ncbi:MAG: hypothetical protein HDT40_13290 [Lachnospiraceae bacterium]|nr:hypothetical protein [Lachnospiraceae bacterium]
MLFLLLLIIIYSVIYLAIYILAHFDGRMVKPLTIMTVGMLVLLLLTAAYILSLGHWYISVVICMIMLGLGQFFLYLLKY